MNSRITFTKKYKLNILLVIAFGAILTLAGFLTQPSEASGWWANMLLDGYFFLALAGGAAFFVAVHSVANSGWHTSLQRIPEAMAAFLPVGGLLMLLMLPGVHSIYHWTHPEGDALLEAKSAWLNVPFFVIRSIVYVALWSFLFMLVRRVSLAMDEHDDALYFNKLKRYSALFIIFFIFTFYIASWDWLMSLDPHWFSTIYGFYIIAGMLAASVAMIILLLALFRWLGYFQHVNDEHIHDLGKYLFGFSIFWGYLWGSQFLLIWFSNIPEEGVYYVERLNNHYGLFVATGIINFVLPTLLLMTRFAKRNMIWLGSIALLVLIGQWINFYLAIMPGASHADMGFGLREIGMAILYLGLFLYVVFTSIAKANQVPTKHPFLKESFEYENTL